jgi:Max protein
LQASRAQILKKAAEYIQFMRRKNNSHQQDIDDLKRQNSVLEAQSNYFFIIRFEFFSNFSFQKLLVRTLERARASGNFAESSEALENIKSDISSSHEEESTDNEHDEGDSRRNKRMKAF